MSNLFDAVLYDDISSLRSLLCDGYSVHIDMSNELSRTMQLLVGLRSSKNSNAMLELLLNNGANVNERGVLGITPALELVMKTGTLEREAKLQMLKKLLDHGADINTCSQIGESMLYVAAEMGWKELVELLLRRGADIDICHDCTDDFTPLQIATYLGHEAVARFLVEHGASLSHRNMRGQTAAHLAAFSECYPTRKDATNFERWLRDRAKQNRIARRTTLAIAYDGKYGGGSRFQGIDQGPMQMIIDHINKEDSLDSD
jgi:hypothetical protein